MPVQQLAPPTIIEIERELHELEERYNITTDAFLAADGCVPDVDEDDAVEWLYRVEQLQVLREVEPVSPYSRGGRATLKSCDSVMDLMDRLAA